MGQTAYIYSIADDFPAGGVNQERLGREIGESSIVTSLVSIITGTGGNSDRIDIIFADALSSGEKTALDGNTSDPAGGLIAAHDNSPWGDNELEWYENRNSIETDPETLISGPWWIIEILAHRRELYNDTDNPLHLEDFTPILGEDGLIQGVTDRIASLENIHAKLGWHNQQVLEGKFTRPRDMMIFYGWLNSFNSGDNGWDNQKVAQDLARYGMMVFGDGIQNPSHGDYANTQVIVPRIKALNPNALIFGYVSVNQSLADFKSKVDQWNTLGVHGIFMDEAGYDYGKNRAEFNERVDYVHGKTTSNLCFANSWNTDHILGTANDASYPNSTYNSGLVASKLGINDWVLLESFPINTTAYSGTAGYESKSDWAARGVKAIYLRSVYGVNFAACGIVNDDNASGQNLFDFGFISAMQFSLDGFGISDTSYGASSSKGKFWTRPDVSKMGVVWSISPAVQADVSDGDVYWRFVENGKFKLDFSTGAQLSAITKL